ncbi:MAG: pentapeptide repeat-containing protein [Caldilineaceae bacterium]|nr:pentapeptide repeat-containing protein [Caldilineaceae bacterium]
MIVPIVLIGFIFLALPILASNYITQTRQTIMRRMVLWLVLIAVSIVGIFGIVRYRALRAVRCAPTCIGEYLIGRDLSGAVLRNGDFTEANLSGANLSNADLYGVNFSGANLTGVNLQGANLNGARLTGATLIKADLRGAQLNDTDLRGADLSETDLTQVNLTQVHLDGVTFTGAKLVETQLQEKNLAGVSFVNADLTGANLSGAILTGSRLSNANLSGARLQAANLAGSWLNLSNLTGVNLANARLVGANLIGTNLSSANLTGSRLVDASLIGAQVNGANLRAADLSGVRLLSDELTPVDLLTDPILQQLNELQLLHVIADVDLAGVSFDRNTQWPIGNTSFLAEMLGQRFFDYTMPAAGSSDSAALAPNTIRIAGTSALMPLTQAVYNLYAQSGYTSTLLIDNIDVATAFAQFCSGNQVEIVMSHRPPSAEESHQCANQQRNPTGLTIGQQAFVVVVNPQNLFLNDLSLPIFNQIAVAERWSDVNLDWPREAIMRYVPDVGSVSFEFWADRVFGTNIGAVAQAPQTYLSANNAQVVQGVVSQPYSVGVLDFAYYQQNATALKLLPINGVMPTEQSVMDGSYLLSQPLFLYIDSEQLAEQANLHEFLQFYLEHVDQIIGQTGLFPVAPSQLEESKRKLIVLQSRRANKGH